MIARSAYTDQETMRRAAQELTKAAWWIVHYAEDSDANALAASVQVFADKLRQRAIETGATS